MNRAQLDSWLSLIDQTAGLPENVVSGAREAAFEIRRQWAQVGEMRARETYAPGSLLGHRWKRARFFYSESEGKCACLAELEWSHGIAPIQAGAFHWDLGGISWRSVSTRVREDQVGEQEVWFYAETTVTKVGAGPVFWSLEEALQNLKRAGSASFKMYPVETRRVDGAS